MAKRTGSDILIDWGEAVASGEPGPTKIMRTVFKDKGRRLV
jgi:hypothetical protein